MRISFCCIDTQAQPWLEGLRAEFPDAGVDIWSAGAPCADYAVVWMPPQQFFDEQTLLKGIFNFTPATTWLQAVAWVSYVAVVMTLFLRPVRPAATVPAKPEGSHPAAVS